MAVLLALVALFMGMAGGGAAETVPDVVGMTSAKAQARLDADDLEHREKTVDDPKAKAGTVVAQTPKAGSSANDEEVVLSIASGKMDVPASQLRGMTVAEARERLEELGFAVTTTEVVSSETAGTVIAVDPSGRLPIGSTVKLTVAKAAPVQQPTAQPQQQQKQQPKQDKGGPGGGKGKGPGGKKP
ncbi:MAG: PASTA domain-containing protein [Aeromicrobium erythreum]